MVCYAEELWTPQFEFVYHRAPHELLQYTPLQLDAMVKQLKDFTSLIAGAQFGPAVAGNGDTPNVTSNDAPTRRTKPHATT